MSTKAKLTIKRIDSKESRMELHAGEKGTGELLWSCIYWPQSDSSTSHADDMLDQFLVDHDIALVQQEA